MKIKALRGVCIGIERHLKPGEEADLPPQEVQFLVSIGAVELVKDEPARTPDPEPARPPAPAAGEDAGPPPSGRKKAGK
jgi:hypothetical protein